RAASLRVHVQGHHARVALHASEMIAERSVRLMLQIAAQGSDRPVDAGMLVDLAIAAPAAASAVEQAHHAVGIRIAVAQVRAEIFRRARKAVAGGADETRVALALDLGAQRRRYALIGVQAQHPVVYG